MAMRDYDDMKEIVIPKEQEEMMNIICDAWEECRTLNSCKECHDRPKEYMRMMMCTSLKYTRKLLENGYSKRGHGHWIPENDRPCSTKWICSECHEIAYNKQRNGNPKICTLKFCPYCGAKIGEGVELAMSMDKTMKCADCLHYEACQSWIRHGTALWDDFHYSVEDCPFYEDKSEWVHLPCKVGDIVYCFAPCFDTDNHPKLKVVEAEILEVRTTATVLGLNFDVDKIGKTVFLTKEEAEKALAEREDK